MTIQEAEKTIRDHPRVRAGFYDDEEIESYLDRLDPAEYFANIGSAADLIADFEDFTETRDAIR